MYKHSTHSKISIYLEACLRPLGEYTLSWKFVGYTQRKLLQSDTCITLTGVSITLSNTFISMRLG